MEIPITQSKEWQKLQNDLNEQSFFKQEESFQYLAILKSTPVGNYLYCPYGPCYDSESSFQESLKQLQSLAKKHNAVFIRIEPRDPNFSEYAPRNTKKSHDLNPKETWILDITGNDNDLKSRLPSRLLRYYKSATKKGITIKKSHNPEEITHLLRLQKALAKEKGITTFSEDYLKTELKQPFATLYLVEFNPLIESQEEPLSTKRGTINQSETIAAGLVFDDRTTRYNLQGAQSEQGRKLHATGILTIELILDAKAKNLQKFDFWGIAPEGAPKNHPWAGFTNFKKTFAGFEQDYAGTYDIILSPSKYKLYQASRKLNRFIRH